MGIWEYGNMGCVRDMLVMLYVYSYGYCSVLLLSYNISSGALGSPYLLLSYTIIVIPIPNTIILI